MDKRMSMFSASSLQGPSRNAGQQSSQVSTTTLLNALHTIYSSGQTYSLDATTSLAVNTWLHAAESGHGEAIIDEELPHRAWEHARRRAEDGCIVLGSLHQSTPSVLNPMVSSLPISTPQTLLTALTVVRAFTCHVTPFNPSYARHSSLAVSFTLNLNGDIRGASIALSKSGIDTQSALTRLPEERGYRAFDVFYYLLNAASTPAEREFLGLKHPSVYALLNRSGTYDPPAYLPTADDAAAGEDFRDGLKEMGIKGADHRNLLSILAGLLKLGDTLGFLIDGEELDDVCEEVAGLFAVEPEVIARHCSTDDRAVLASGLYECLVDWIISKANYAIEEEVQVSRAEASSGNSGMRTPDSDEEPEDVVSITVVEIPSPDLGKAVALRSVFNDSMGINSEMKDDGVEVVAPGASVLREMQNALNEAAVDLDIPGAPASRDREHEHDRREAVLEKVAREAEEGTFLQKIVFPVDGEGVLLGKHARFDLADTILSSRVWFHLSIHPTDDPPSKLATLSSPNAAWSAGTVSRQLRAWRLPEWANRRNRNLDYTADFDIEEFAKRYSRLGCQEGRDGVESWITERGWSNGDAVVGKERVWIREAPWWEVESMIDMKAEAGEGINPFDGPSPQYGSDVNRSGFFPEAPEENPFASRDNLISQQPGYLDMAKPPMSTARSIAPTMARTANTLPGDYGLGAKGDEKYGYDAEYEGQLDPEFGDGKHITTEPVTFSRRAWVALVWAVTLLIPSFMLRHVGRMKRPDVRLAWREKLVLCMLILFLNGAISFWIIEFGRLLCPNFDKVWNAGEVAFHTGDDDFWVAIHGKVYDISSFWQQDHSDVSAALTNKQTMQPFGGQDLDEYFPPPLYLACSSLLSDKSVQLLPNGTIYNSNAVHKSGSQTGFTSSALSSDDWYTGTFIPKITKYYKGDLVWDAGNVSAEGKENQHPWVILNGNIYDFTDYFHTQDLENPNNVAPYNFLPNNVVDIIKGSAGQDVTSQWGTSSNFTNSLDCMNNAFYVGKTDFRYSARCQVNNYILLAFAVIICIVIGVKFLAALQFGSKRRPALQDKFVLCQVPAYTEGEESLRKSLDSLTALEYDNKRKLICVICDGMIVGGGNDRPTPKIVLDILGVDPKIDPPALPFKSVGQASDQLNYGKVYSGLYEFEGNVVPYIVIVKVGKESEQTKSKPGNRGKRDSQLLMMSFLNRVHHRAPMNPLELEIFHQINNIIGVDPELYEYLFMVDADTAVREDSLNRLVARCANDVKIAGICGETSLQNEGRSWTTMIQVYEYYISHHLAKSFESLFGSVTCLPGCFSMYRLRTADKGRPLIISEKIIAEYGVGEVDTLHKKNLFSLGEDRYLTTLMTKHFPNMSYKFVPDAYAATAAPESWSVLLSQRRRWINSTVHNLAELVFLDNLCGFCCFSMRFVVFIDLLGTLILPATCAYIGYLIYLIASDSGPFPLISVIMIAAAYGLQALIFLLKRQWQHIGWMIIYLLAFPIYSFVIPVYSFWKQDDFSWGTTRIVIGEKGNKQVVAIDSDTFDPSSIPLQRWDDYATQQNLPGRRGYGNGQFEPAMAQQQQGYSDNAYEMDDMRTVYSEVRPASTVLTGFGAVGAHQHASAFMPPQSPGPMAHLSRQSTALSLGQFHDAPQYGAPPPRPGVHSRVQSSLGFEPYRDVPGALGSPMSDPRASQHDIGRYMSPSPNQGFQQQAQRRQSRSPLGGMGGSSRPVSAVVDFRGPTPGGSGPDEGAIADAIRSCLAEVDLDTVTKKQVRALVEQRLQVEIGGEKRNFMDRQIDAELANM